MPPMLTDLDIYRSAKLLIDQHGADAIIEAALKADELLDAGDCPKLVSPTFDNCSPAVSSRDYAGLRPIRRSAMLAARRQPTRRTGSQSRGIIDAVKVQCNGILWRGIKNRTASGRVIPSTSISFCNYLSNRDESLANNDFSRCSAYRRHHFAGMETLR